MRVRLFRKVNGVKYETFGILVLYEDKDNVKFSHLC